MSENKAKLKAIAKYNRNNTKTYCLRLNRNTDADLIEFLSTLDNKQGLIKKLLRKYINVE